MSLAHTFEETNEQTFDNNNYWDMLSLAATKLGKDSNTSDHDVDSDIMLKFTISIFDQHKKTKDDCIVDHFLLDDKVMSALNDNLVHTGDNDTNDNHSPIVLHIRRSLLSYAHTTFPFLLLQCSESSSTILEA